MSHRFLRRLIGLLIISFLIWPLGCVSDSEDKPSPQPRLGVQVKGVGPTDTKLLQVGQRETIAVFTVTCDVWMRGDIDLVVKLPEGSEAGYDWVRDIRLARANDGIYFAFAQAPFLLGDHPNQLFVSFTEKMEFDAGVTKIEVVAEVAAEATGPFHVAVSGIDFGEGVPKTGVLERSWNCVVSKK